MCTLTIIVFFNHLLFSYSNCLFKKLLVLFVSIYLTPSNILSVQLPTRLKYIMYQFQFQNKWILWNFQELWQIALCYKIGKSWHFKSRVVMSVIFKNTYTMKNIDKSYHLRLAALLWEAVKLRSWVSGTGGFPDDSVVKNLMQIQSLSQEDPLEREMATHSNILAWEIPWTEESGRLLSMGRHESDIT